MRPDGLVQSDGPAILGGSDAPSLQVPEGFDIFSAQYSRDGDDLVIAAQGGPPLTVLDYFSADSPPALEMPNGTMLTGDVVELLAGPRAPGQYAQADAPEGAESIGRVETLSGTSTATRVSGETVELAQGDPVFQGDVIETAGESTLGIRLEDGTLASMSSQSRLVLNEFVFETGGSDNWMLVNLVEGAFAFLTGAIAPSGGMEITTPVAVMAIRGTMPVAFVSGEDGATDFFAASDKDYELLHLMTREVLGIVSSAVGFSLSSPDAPLQTIELDPETQGEIDGLLQTLNEAAAELGLLGIQDDSGFHIYSPFGSIDGNLAALIEFLLLLDDALAEEAVLEVEDPNQFLMAEAELIANPDVALTDELSPVIINVLDNDFHPDNGDLTVVFADVPNGQGSVTIVDGQYLVYDPGTDFDYLALGETTNVVITYVVSDSTGAVASTTATVTLTGINQAPVIAPVGETSLDEQTDTQPLNATIAVTFTDVDLNNVGHTAAVVGVAVNGEDGGLTLDDAALMALVSPGTVIKNAGDSSGSVDFFFTAAYTVFDYLAEGEVVTLTYTFEIDDGDGGTTLQTFDVTITGTNDAATITGTATGTVTEDGASDGDPSTVQVVSGTLTVSDPDAGEDVFQAVSAANLIGAYGSFTFNELTGQWTYTLDNNAAHVQALTEGQEVTDTLLVTSLDGTASKTITVTIVGVGDVATITGTATGTVTEDGASDGDPSTVQVVSGTLTVSDPDAGENVFKSVSAAALIGTYGSFTFNELTGQWTYTLDNDAAHVQALTEGQEVTDTLLVTSLDGTASKTITVTIVGVNDAATITGTATGTVTEDGASDGDPSTVQVVSGTLTVSDPDAGENVFKSVSAAALIGTYGSFTFNELTGQWSYTLDNDAAHVQALRDGEEVTDTLLVTSFDGTDSQTITVTIVGVNDEATISGTATGTVTEDGASDGDPSTVQVVSGTLTVSDPDAGEDVFQAVSPAALIGTYGSFTFNELTGQWSYTLDNDAAHVQALTEGQEVTDTLLVTSLDGTDSQTITVTIVGVNDAATITGTATGTVTEDGASDGDPSTVQVVSGTLTVSDPDAGENVFKSVSPAALIGTYGSFTFNELTGQWSYTLDNDAAHVQALARWPGGHRHAAGDVVRRHRQPDHHGDHRRRQRRGDDQRHGDRHGDRGRRFGRRPVDGAGGVRHPDGVGSRRRRRRVPGGSCCESGRHLRQLHLQRTDRAVDLHARQ
jgi:VCBS repeat-containing protein